MAGTDTIIDMDCTNGDVIVAFCIVTISYMSDTDTVIDIDCTDRDFIIVVCVLSI